MGVNPTLNIEQHLKLGLDLDYFSYFVLHTAL